MIKKIVSFAAVIVVAACLSFPQACFGLEICFKNRKLKPVTANAAELTDNEIKLIYTLQEINKIVPYLGTRNWPGSAGVEIFFKDKSRKSFMTKAAAVKIIEISEKEMKLVYPLDIIESINGITGLSRAKLTELEGQGYQYLNEKKYDEAVQLFEKLIDIDSNNAAMVTGMAKALAAIQKHPQSVPYILREIELNPESWEAYKRLGNAYRHMDGKDQDSLNAYKKVIEIQGANTVNMFDLGETYRARLGKPQEALPYLEKAVSLDPDSKEIRWFFYNSLGDCYQSLGRHQEAIDAYQKTIEKFPPTEANGKAYYKAYEGQSRSYSALKQEEKALECKHKAKETGFKYT
jgi:tetratricopeptide (TPR) repeat protein